MTRRIAVVGGGIAGLTFAVACAHLVPDVELTLVERSPVLTAVGAGIVLWPNALRALAVAGIPAAEVNAVALRGLSGGIRSADGTWLSRTDIDAMSAAIGQTAALHRADLIELLRRHLPDGVLRLGRTALSVTPQGRLTCDDGVADYDVVVVADGLRSTLRSQLWPRVHPMDSGVTAWRWVLPDPDRRHGEGFEMWGPAGAVGVVPLAGAQLYVYAVAPTVSVTGDDVRDLRRFASWAEPVATVVSQARNVLRHPLADLPPAPRYTTGRVALMGDAAHAMLPFLGQGACMGIEDAATLATLLANGDVDTALSRYTALRVPRCRLIQARSRTAGRLAMARHPVVVALRNAAVRATPPAATVRAMAALTSWQPPGPSAVGES